MCRGHCIFTGIICAVASKPLRRCTFNDFESLALASLRRWRMFQQLFRRPSPLRKHFGWAFGGPAGGKRVAACGMRRGAMARIVPTRPARAAFNDHVFRNNMLILRICLREDATITSRAYAASKSGWCGRASWVAISWRLGGLWFSIPLQSARTARASSEEARPLTRTYPPR